MRFKTSFLNHFISNVIRSFYIQVIPGCRETSMWIYHFNLFQNINTLCNIWEGSFEWTSHFLVPSLSTLVRHKLTFIFQTWMMWLWLMWSLTSEWVSKTHSWREWLKEGCTAGKINIKFRTFVTTYNSHIDFSQNSRLWMLPFLYQSWLL